MWQEILCTCKLSRFLVLLRVLSHVLRKLQCKVLDYSTKSWYLDRIMKIRITSFLTSAELRYLAVIRAFNIILCPTWEIIRLCQISTTKYSQRIQNHRFCRLLENDFLTFFGSISNYPCVVLNNSATIIFIVQVGLVSQLGLYTEKFIGVILIEFGIVHGNKYYFK